MSETVDAVIIGGGIAGVSAGYYLARAGLTVHLVEAEPTLAYHTTGRSAATYLVNFLTQQRGPREKGRDADHLSAGAPLLRSHERGAST